MIAALYAAVARRRRAWYEGHPEARRRLSRPVVSVGNIAVGGRGKTPTVAHVARVLAESGERPVILSRGYARRVADDGVVVVRDRDRILADLARAGDEPLMLARQLQGVPVLVAVDRHLAGVLAEHRFDASVHLLDDGFQHLRLERRVDLVLLDEADLDERYTLPRGRLREPLDSLARADAVITAGGIERVRSSVERLGIRHAFELTRRLGMPRLVAEAAVTAPLASGSRIMAMAGIARPQRFAEDLEAGGWTIAGTRWFRDHHPYSRADVEDVLREANALRADMVLTTEKDLVRLLPVVPAGAPLAWVPLAVQVEPAGTFRAWLLERLRA